MAAEQTTLVIVTGIIACENNYLIVKRVLNPDIVADLRAHAVLDRLYPREGNLFCH